MTERDYILISTLTQVRAVRSCAEHLCAFTTIQRVMPEAELKQLQATLYRWEEGLSNMVKVRT